MIYQYTCSKLSLASYPCQTTPVEAISMMASGSAHALDIAKDGGMTPVGFSTWLTLPVRGQDHSIGTVRGAVRLPTVLAHDARVPKQWFLQSV